MAFAYTPGLRVADVTIVRKERRLPLTGETLVEKGQEVSAESVVARTELPGNVKMLNIANVLGLPPSDIPSILIKSPGDTIAEDEVLGQTKGLWGLFKNSVRSPVEGTFESLQRDNRSGRPEGAADTGRDRCIRKGHGGRSTR